MIPITKIKDGISTFFDPPTILESVNSAVYLKKIKKSESKENFPNSQIL